MSLKVPANIKDTKICLAVTLPSSVNNEIYFPDQDSSDSCRYKAFNKTLADTTNTELDGRQVTLADLNPMLVLENDLTS